MTRIGAATLQDVAREAGVSKVTVSAILNGTKSETRVSPATRERIVAAAARLNYRRNATAHALATRRTDTVGIAIQTPEDRLESYSWQVMHGVLEAAAPRDKIVSVITVSDWTADSGRLLNLCDGRVDGMILVAPIGAPEPFLLGLQSKLPLVLLHSDVRCSDIPCLDIDNEAGAYTATKHLIDLGHKRIGHLAGDLRFRAPQLRLRGYRGALEDHGLPFRDDWVFPGDFGPQSGVANAPKVLALGDSGPTALFCVNDLVASECMGVLRAHGKTAPRDYSIVGFDDAPFSTASSPPITTIRQPLRQMGIAAIALLLDLIQQNRTAPVLPPSDNASATRPRIELFDLDLIVRESTGAPTR